MMMHQTMKWFGPKDPVSLADIQQSGCTGVVTALHQVPVGDTWTKEAIHERKQMIEDAGMTWTVVESLPVTEDIKKQSGNYLVHIEHYKQSLRNLAQCGIKVVTYHFMPLLNPLYTDISFTMADGSKGLYFERSALAAFDLFLLNRPGAEKDYTTEEINQATERFARMNGAEKEKLFSNIMLGLPGGNHLYTPSQVLSALGAYSGIDAKKLKTNLYFFLKQVLPVAEETGIKLAIHPDNPPQPVLGLPRIMSTEQDAAEMIEAVPSPANGLCFCTGSFGISTASDWLRMLGRFADHVHFLHFRNTKRDAAGNIYEATQLENDPGLHENIREMLKFIKTRPVKIPIRPVHGNELLDYHNKKTAQEYSIKVRLQDLAVLRGLEMDISKNLLSA